ncbi:MAG: hypothetical protein WC389_16290 [Lutibacter sp.]
MTNVVIKGVNYVVPEEVNYLQYYTLSKILQEVKVKLNEILDVQKKADGVIETSLNVASVIEALMESDKLPDVFSVLLVPENTEYWTEDLIEKNRENMKYLGDKTFVSILTDFLNGRGTLIMSLMDYLSPLLNASKTLLDGSNQNEKEETSS